MAQLYYKKNVVSIVNLRHFFYRISYFNMKEKGMSSFVNKNKLTTGGLICGFAKRIKKDFISYFHYVSYMGLCKLQNNMIPTDFV